MRQMISGFHSVLSSPAIYSAFQNIMGARRFRVGFVKEFVRPFAKNTILDIGCGPADILAYLPDVDYWGFDISERYIEQAKKQFGTKGIFHCRKLTDLDIEIMPPFDIVLALGLLHHLDDDGAVGIMRLANKALKSGGRLLTVDPCFAPGQNSISRFLVRNDRGRNVRTSEEYLSIACQVFDSPYVDVRHRYWVPYTHCFMECAKK